MVYECHSSIFHTSVDIHIDIQAGIFMQGHSTIDIRETNINGWISMFL